MAAQEDRRLALLHLVRPRHRLIPALGSLVLVMCCLIAAPSAQTTPSSSPLLSLIAHTRQETFSLSDVLCTVSSTARARDPITGPPAIQAGRAFEGHDGLFVLNLAGAKPLTNTTALRPQGGLAELLYAARHTERHLIYLTLNTDVIPASRRPRLHRLCPNPSLTALLTDTIPATLRAAWDTPITPELVSRHITSTRRTWKLQWRAQVTGEIVATLLIDLATDLEDTRRAARHDARITRGVAIGFGLLVLVLAPLIPWLVRRRRRRPPSSLPSERHDQRDTCPVCLGALGEPPPDRCPHCLVTVASLTPDQAEHVALLSTLTDIAAALSDTLDTCRDLDKSAQKDRVVLTTSNLDALRPTHPQYDAHFEHLERAQADVAALFAELDTPLYTPEHPLYVAVNRRHERLYKPSYTQLVQHLDDLYHALDLMREELAMRQRVNLA